MSSDANPPSPERAPERAPLVARLLRWARQTPGMLFFAGRRFYDDNCFQTAASLTYTTLLAVVP